MVYFIIFASAYMVTFLVTPFIRYFALRLSLIDKRGQRKIHTKVITRFGGVAIYAGFIFPLILLIFLKRNIATWDLNSASMIVGASTMILLLGIYDDAKGANALVKLAGQILATIILIYGGLVVKKISNPFGNSIELGFLSVPFTILWVVGITNAINLIDGLDGLAAGIVFITSLGLFFIFVINGKVLPAMLIIALGGSCLGFLKYNVFPAKIFMGDTGSLFLGFSIAAITIASGHKANATVMLLVPIIGLGIPILDTSMAFFRRLIKRKNPFNGDNQHIHHFLLSKRLTKKQTVFILWGVTALLNIVICVFMSVGKG